MNYLLFCAYDQLNVDRRCEVGFDSVCRIERPNGLLKGLVISPLQGS